MADLYLHGRQLHSVFELLGTKENDITYSIGWALAQSPCLLAAFLQRVLGRADLEGVSVYLQEHAEDGGYTDIEVVGQSLHVIVEGKRGWWLPGEKQMERYVRRFAGAGAISEVLVVMSECSPEYAALCLLKDVQGVPVRHASWREMESLTHKVGRTHAEKRLLGELRAYLRRIVKVQNQESNSVYVVSLSAKRPAWSQLNWIDIVEKKRRYFHPVGKTWPKEPPNYLGFRYGGRLQSICHVDDWKVVEDFHCDIPEIQSQTVEPHFLYTFGKPIIPSAIVKSGRVVRAMRVWAALDLLLTRETVSDAVAETKKRLAEAG
ncbi:MAG: hypothetical protein M1401_18745 [Chloroflexi bacterium]|nr:hypothetical protein [Chloroflexota bacterium]